MNRLLACRVCLAYATRLCSIMDGQLREIYEKLVEVSLDTEDMLPTSVCYICYSLMKKMLQFRDRSQKANQILQQMISSGLESSVSSLDMLVKDQAGISWTLGISDVERTTINSAEDKVKVKIESVESEMDIDGMSRQNEGPERSRRRPSAACRALLLGLEDQAEARDPEQVFTPPQRSEVLEKVETMDMSEEEGEALPKTISWHAQRWAAGRGKGDGAGANVGRANISNTNVTGVNITKVFSGADAALISEVDARPSTSGVTATSERASSHVTCDGSDADSEFDDEFDVIPVENTARALLKDIPDDEELEEPVRDIVNDIERGMDDEADRLLGISSFTWVRGFDSFRGVPEVFSGPTPGPIKYYDSPYDAFTDIWDRSIIELIVRETNRYAKQTIEDLEAKGNLKPNSRLREWTDTNVDEIMSLFAVFMYMGLDPRTSQNEYWTLDVLEMPKFRRLMPYNRYVLLNKFLHFVDNQQIGEISSATSGFSNRLNKLTPILEHLGQKFSSLYNLGCNVSIDESLTLSKGGSWVQTIKSKAARFGIKSYELCESQTGYMARFQIYTGNTDCAPSDPSPDVDLGVRSTKIILELLQGLEHRGHCVTMDNFYNSPSLARYLKSRGYDCLGSLRRSRRNVSSDIANVPGNVAKGTIVSRQCGDLSIVTWKDSKLVNMISTYHDDGTFAGLKEGKHLKPKCVIDYDNTVGGIDLKNQKLSAYLLERKRGMKWYLKMFKRLLNVSIMNALVMYASSLKRRGETAVTHREFRYRLADSLVRRHACQCQPDVSRPVELTRLKRDILHIPKYERGANNRKRCAVCVRVGVNRMVHSQCVTCEVFVCFEDCWAKWHCSSNLEGREVLGRKRRR